MADLMQFDLVSPERKLISEEVQAVQIPGTEGELTAMPGHAPFLTTLRPGVVRVIKPTGTEEFVVTGGFAEVTQTGTSILAEEARKKEDMSRDMLEELMRRTEEEMANAEADEHIALGQRMHDFRSLIIDMGL
ncbi:ATP synthase F1 subunit epsilon [Paracoccaceae bacterium GXU_MW_L88]